MFLIKSATAKWNSVHASCNKLYTVHRQRDDVSAMHRCFTFEAQPQFARKTVYSRFPILILECPRRILCRSNNVMYTYRFHSCIIHKWKVLYVQMFHYLCRVLSIRIEDGDHEIIKQRYIQNTDRFFILKFSYTRFIVLKI